MERLDFTNLNSLEGNTRNNVRQQKIEAEYLYSRNKTAIKEAKLVELRSCG